MEGKDAVLLFTDSQIIDETMLEDLNNCSTRGGQGRGDFVHRLTYHRRDHVGGLEQGAQRVDGKDTVVLFTD